MVRGGLMASSVRAWHASASRKNKLKLGIVGMAESILDPILLLLVFGLASSLAAL
jgi:hypothetical protein